ncbi:DUF3558 family protein [Nocardia sp. NRRL S-836]|uniref:DUF3558 family protein n=1 Tax=Nocardia sp. NRRL S-836 TaxID=1519492 RepID=UPI0006AFA234|nr:DUF3558 family protein [Nocardia sp. NRRL S-836]
MKRILISVLLGFAALTAACTGTAGTPTPTPTTGGSTPTSGSNASSDLKSIKPCDLITDSEAAGFGFKLPGEAKKRSAVDTCDWTVPGNGGMQVGVRADKGLKDLNLQGEKVSETKVGKFKATKVEAQDGSKDTCVVAIGASETSSVAVIWTVNAGSGDTATACKQASKAADQVAQKLP